MEVGRVLAPPTGRGAAQAAAIVGVIASLSNRALFPPLLLISIFLLHLASMVNRVNRFSLTALLRNRDQIPQANAEVQLMESAARLVGPWMAGMIIAHLKVRAAPWLDMLSFVIMAGCGPVGSARAVPRRGGAQPGLCRDISRTERRHAPLDGVGRVSLARAGALVAAFAVRGM